MATGKASRRTSSVAVARRASSPTAVTRIVFTPETSAAVKVNRGDRPQLVQYVTGAAVLTTVPVPVGDAVDHGAVVNRSEPLCFYRVRGSNCGQKHGS